MYRILVMVLAIMTTLPGLAAASGMPKDGVLDFAILRNGDQIGRHVFRFEARGDPMIVQIVAEIDYRLGFIPLYTFRHNARETWQAGKLVGLTAETNDNGDDYRIALADDGDLTVNDETEAIAVGMRPASLWNNAALGDQTLIDPADGDLMKVSVAAAGAETITVRGTEIQASRYEMTGDFQRTLWYDRQNVLVQVLFSGSDGSEIRYRLR